jgi:hypothetical protein
VKTTVSCCIWSSDLLTKRVDLWTHFASHTWSNSLHIAMSINYYFDPTAQAEFQRKVTQHLDSKNENVEEEILKSNEVGGPYFDIYIAMCL